jgi:hypothetical protein
LLEIVTFLQAERPTWPPGRGAATGSPTCIFEFSLSAGPLDQLGTGTPPGQPIGDLRYDPAEGEASDTAAGVEHRLFNQVVVAIMRAYRRTGSAPTTAHAHY